MSFGSPLYWRETHRQPRFLIFDGRLVIVILLTLMHIRLWTILLALTSILVLVLLERKGVSADSMLRFLRSSFVGRNRTARGVHAERMPIDFGFETRSMVLGAEEQIRRHQKARREAAEKKARKAAARKPGGGHVKK